MNYFIVTYWSGFHKMRCLVIADSAEDATKLFLLSNPKLRSYNLISVSSSGSRVYQLAG